MTKHELISDYYITHREELLTYVGSRLGGNMAAKDIVQDVFLRLLESDKLTTETTLPALVYTTARHLIIDYYRHHASTETYAHYIRHASRSEESAETVVSVRELTELMERGLARVPEQCREIYRMHICGNMKVGEISRQLGEGYKSVEHRLGTARKAVRQYLRNYA